MFAWLQISIIYLERIQRVRNAQLHRDYFGFIIGFVILRTYAKIAINLDLLNRHRRFAFPEGSTPSTPSNKSFREFCVSPNTVQFNIKFLPSQSGKPSMQV
jgi:hypothetical protein